MIHKKILLLFITFSAIQVNAQFVIDINKTTTTPPSFSCDCEFNYGTIPFKAFWGLNGLTNDSVICSKIGIATPPFCGHIAFYKSDLPNYEDIDSIRIYQDGPRDLPFGINSNINSPFLGSSSFVPNSDSLLRFYITGWTFEDYFFTTTPIEPLIKIDIKYKNGNTNNCFNQDIINVENILANPGVHLREDYHEYWDETVICKNCSELEVWNFMKTKRYYQVPTYDDFPASTGSLCLPDINVGDYNGKNVPLLLIKNALWVYRNTVQLAQHSVTPLDVPIQNCDDVFLTPTPLRVLGGMIVNVASLQEIQLVPPTATCDVSLAQEPVKVTIEEPIMRMTNYTLKGHFLYPGKVERYVVKDDCSGEVKVITHGVGVTTCGDNWAGGWIAYLNTCTGKHTFKSVSNHLSKDFKKK